MMTISQFPRCRCNGFISLLLIGLVTSNAALAAIDEVPISFGIVPQQSASTLARVWSPILHHLSQQTERRFVFRTAPDIPTFEQRLAEGRYDIAYMNPYHYVVFNEKAGYEAFAKARDKQIKGVLVVREDSDITTLEALDGMTLAFPAPAAFAASVLPQAHLRQQGVEFTPKYVSSHDSVYRAVAQGLYPVGGGVVRTFTSMDASVSDQLRILWTTPAYTSHAIAAHPRLPGDVVNAIGNALVAMDQTADGASLLQALSIKGFEAARDEQWNDVRGLSLQTAVGTRE